MNNNISPRPSTRREFLKSGAKGIGLIAFSQYAPCFLTQASAAQLPGAEKDRSILVVIQLAGGNDGLNTLVPFEDDQYYNLRPSIAIKPDQVHRIGDNLGFHPDCRELANLYREGNLSVIQNVGYPNPNRSHFRSTEIWETASDSEDNEYTGWLGRYLDNACCGAPSDAPEAIHLTQGIPQSFSGSGTHSIFGVNPSRKTGMYSPNRDLLEGLTEAPSDGDNAQYLQHTLMDALITEQKIDRIISADKAEARYPGDRLAQSLKRIAAMIAAGLETRVYFTSLGGFDTHVNQTGTHARLMGQLSKAMAAFQEDLLARGLDKQVLTMTFSEFGRRPNENNGLGTDHGTSAPLFAMGTQLNKKLLGEAPSLNVGKNKDLTYSTDFRRVYSTVLNRWFECPNAKNILGSDFKPLDFI